MAMVLAVVAITLFVAAVVWTYHCGIDEMQSPVVSIMFLAAILIGGFVGYGLWDGAAEADAGVPAKVEVEKG